jgi:hypothetical protein
MASNADEQGCRRRSLARLTGFTRSMAPPWNALPRRLCLPIHNRSVLPRLIVVCIEQ